MKTLLSIWISTAFLFISSESLHAGLAREVIEKCKHGTVLIVYGDKISGTAFCVHKSGLFVTNDHVVDAIGRERDLVVILNPSEANQKSTRASVVRRDKELDLALIAVRSVRDMEPLPLGGIDALFETMTVTAFGYPFGKLLALEEEHFPSISINRGGISSLRKVKGELNRIQLDAELNPGNSGGPVVDDEGNVIGVVVSGVLGRGVNFAIPVSHLKQFLAKADIRVLDRPSHPYAKRYEPAAFRVRVVTFDRSTEPLNVKMILRAGDLPERTIQLEPETETIYTASAPLMDPGQGPPVVRLSAEYDDRVLNGTVHDRRIKVGDESFPLSEVRLIELGVQPRMMTHRGTRRYGLISGLEDMTVLAGGEEIAVDLAKATIIRLYGSDQYLPAVDYRIVVTRANKEIGQTVGRVRFLGVPRDLSEHSELRPTHLTDEWHIRKLPSRIYRVLRGGADRYLIIHLKEVRSLAVFDLQQARVVNYIPTGTEHVLFTAGADMLILVQPEQKIIQRWNLTTFERDLNTTLPFLGRPIGVAMGSHSDSPLLINTRHVSHFVDPHKMTRMTFRNDPTRQHRLFRQGPCLASADGTFFLTRGQRGLLVLRVSDNVVSGQYKSNIVTRPMPQPNDDATQIYGRGVIYTPKFEIWKDQSIIDLLLIPAQGIHYFLGIGPTNVGLFTASERQLIYTFTKQDLGPMHSGRHEGLDAEHPGQRYHLFPHANLLAVVPPSNDRVLLSRFDLDEILEHSELDFFYIESRPVREAVRGRLYAYQLNVKSKRGGLKYTLVSGPEGMSISPYGKVTWDVPAGGVGQEVGVIIQVTDASGQERTQSYVIRAADPKKAESGHSGNLLRLHAVFDKQYRAGRCNIILLRGTQRVHTIEDIRTDEGLEPEGLIAAEIELPPISFERIRFEITSSGAKGGGLAEIELVNRNGKNLLSGCLVTASASRGVAFSAKNVVDGQAPGRQTGARGLKARLPGVWLLPEGELGWIEIDVEKRAKE